MVGRLVVSVLLVVFIVGKSEAVDLATVIDIRSARGVFSAAEKVFYCPSTVRGTTGSVSALRSVALAIPPARGAVIAQALISAGLLYAGTKLIDYLATQAFMVVDGQLVRVTSGSYPSSTVNGAADYVGGDYVTGTSYLVRYIGYFDTLSAAQSAVDTYVAGGSWPYKSNLSSLTGLAPPSGNFNFDQHNMSGFSYVRMEPAPPAWVDVIAFSPKLGVEMKTISSTNPATVNEIQTAVSDGLSIGDQLAVDGLTQSLARVEQSLNVLSDPLNSTAQRSVIQSELDASIPLGTSAVLDTLLSDPNASQIYTDQAMQSSSVSSDQLTQGQVQQAVKSALDDETGVSAPVDPILTQPDKKNITSVLTAFMSSIQSLAFMQTLNGIQVISSGSSVLCLALPAVYGGQQCWDAGGISGQLSLAGSMLLAAVTLVSFIYIFRSS